MQDYPKNSLLQLSIVALAVAAVASCTHEPLTLGGVGGEPSTNAAGGSPSAGGEAGSHTDGGGAAGASSTAGAGGIATGGGGGAGRTDCGGELVDITTDPNHCGACNAACDLASDQCFSGVCTCQSRVPSGLLPTVHALDVASMTLGVVFPCTLDPGSVSVATVKAYGSISGPLSGTLSLPSPGEVQLALTTPYQPGERVTLLRANALTTLDGSPLGGQHSFTARVTVPLPSAFVDSGQSLGANNSKAVALGDLDGDNDLDAFVANGPGSSADRVWLNDGAGVFTDSGQSLGTAYSTAVALGDLDGDNDLDAYVTSSGGGPVTVWINNGSGVFSAGGNLGTPFSRGVALGDIDADGDLDALESNDNQFRVLSNNGAGLFNVSSTAYAGPHVGAIASGDVDTDGDLDALVAQQAWVGDLPNGGSSNRLNKNDGTGTFMAASVAAGHTLAAAFADIDGDGDVDLFLANYLGTELWLNNGVGGFTDSGQYLGGYASDVTLADIDGDGDLDLVLGGASTALWINDGAGVFSPGLALPFTGNSVALGDLDGDGDVDAFLARDNENRVLLMTPN